MWSAKRPWKTMTVSYAMEPQISVRMKVSSGGAPDRSGQAGALSRYLYIEGVNEKAGGLDTPRLEEDADCHVGTRPQALVDPGTWLAGRSEVVGWREHLARHRAVQRVAQRHFERRQGLRKTGAISDDGRQLEDIGAGNRLQLAADYGQLVRLRRPAERAAECLAQLREHGTALRPARQQLGTKDHRELHGHQQHEQEGAATEHDRESSARWPCGGADEFGLLLRGRRFSDGLDGRHFDHFNAFERSACGFDGL